MLAVLCRRLTRIYFSRAQWGFHPGGWGKPPLDEYNRPLYGDVFGVLPKNTDSNVGEPIDRNTWGELEPEEGTSLKHTVHLRLHSHQSPQKNPKTSPRKNPKRRRMILPPLQTSIRYPLIFFPSLLSRARAGKTCFTLTLSVNVTSLPRHPKNLRRRHSSSHPCKIRRTALLLWPRRLRKR